MVKRLAENKKQASTSDEKVKEENRKEITAIRHPTT